MPQTYKDYAPYAKKRILELLGKIKIATEREIKVRLERDPVAENRWHIRGFFPWVIGFAIRALLHEGKIESHGYRGRVRLGSGTPSKFYCLKSTPYRDIEPLIAEKRRLSKYINALLTEKGIATIHAQEAFREAFEQMGFNLKGRDISEFSGRKVPHPHAGPPPNVDFAFEKDGVVYGVDVKNWLAYEEKTIQKVMVKVWVCHQLDLIPFIVARYIDDDTMFRIISKGGLVYRYWELIVPKHFDSLAHKVHDLLGFPVIAVDELPPYVKKRLVELHSKKLKGKNENYVSFALS